MTSNRSTNVVSQADWGPATEDSEMIFLDEPAACANDTSQQPTGLSSSAAYRTAGVGAPAEDKRGSRSVSYPEGLCTDRSPNTCSCLRAPVRGFQRTEQPAMVTTWPTACRVHVHFAGVRQSVWDRRELAHSQVSALDRRWRLACAVLSPPLFPRPMYRITCPSRTRPHARSQVLAIHRGLMYRITAHYPVALPAVG